MKIFRKEKSALFFFKPTMQNLAPKEKVSLSYLMKKKKKKKTMLTLLPWWWVILQSIVLMLERILFIIFQFKLKVIT